MRKRQSDKFEPYKNPSYDFVYHNQEKIKVRISWKVGFEFMIDLFTSNRNYSISLPAITSKEKIFSNDDINFHGIELNLVEKEKIAKRLNEILNYNFD